MEPSIIWKPQPKQEQALERGEDEILYGGARGGGKTDAGLAWLLYNTGHPRFRALVIRKNSDDLKDWSDRARRMYAGTGAIFVGSPPTIKFPSGAIIRTGHLNDENAYTKYQGHEYQNILIEELSQIARENDYIKLIGSCRSTVPELQPQVFATTNPDDPGIEWIRARWQIPEVPDFDETYVTNTPSGKRLVFIPAKLEDNPYLMDADPNYLKYLESLKETDVELYEAWRNGNWKGFGVEGAYYRQQILNAEKEGRITNVPYEEKLDVYTWCDLGVSDSFSIGYFQVSGMQWRMIDYDEFEGENLGSAIQRMREKGYSYAKHFAPHDIEVRDLSADSVDSSARASSRWEIAKSKGVEYTIVPKMGVQDGINATRMAFSSLWIDKTKCAEFLKKIRRYHKEFDASRGVFKKDPAHDSNSHAGDMLRYWAVSKDSITTSSKTLFVRKPNWDKYGQKKFKKDIW